MTGTTLQTPRTVKNKRKEVLLEQIFICSPGKLILEQAPGRTHGPVERGVHTGAGLLSGLVMP